MSADMAVRLQSWMHAFLKALDRATMAAITAVREDACAHDSLLSWVWGPFGLWRHRLRQAPTRPKLSPNV